MIVYEVGKVYIWQNQVGEDAFLNDQETTVLAGPWDFIHKLDGKRFTGWLTDTYDPNYPHDPGNRIIALAGDLRPKDSPKGEQKIMAMFKTNKELETA
jgi:hypothetical protein